MIAKNENRFARKWLVIVIAIVFGPSIFAKAQDKEIEQAISGLVENHSSIRSGLFRVSGTYKEATLIGDIDDDVEILCAFDFDENTFRLDWSQPTLVSNDGEIEKGFTSTKFVRTKEHVFYWSNSIDLVQVHHVGKNFKSEVDFFDIRFVGVATWNTLRSRTLEEELPWEKFCKNLSKYDTASASGTSVDLAFNHRGLTLNVETGFMPASYRKLKSHPTIDDTPSSVVATWQSIDGLWLPETASYIEAKTQVDLKFEWESVNEGIDEYYMTTDALVEPGTMIMDYRVKPPVVLGVTKKNRLRINVGLKFLIHLPLIFVVLIDYFLSHLKR